MTSLHFTQALLPGGWTRNARLSVTADGTIESVDAGGKAGAPVAGIAIPGMPNLHSHLHQRALAGLTERAGESGDDFWAWRAVMHGFLARMTPDDFEAIAAQAMVEMLKAGYTALVEFHYLHNGPGGAPYDNRAEMAERVIAAARETGIGLTLAPVIYMRGGFDVAPLNDHQKRFALDTDDALAMVEMLAAHHGGPQMRLAIAPHSLRAVSPAQLAAAVAGAHALDHAMPIHIHIAEQMREVEECQAATGKRPVEWLLDAHDVDGRWCLVHATHMTDAETKRLAQSGAVVGLCPTTEANLGDGLFPMADYLAQGGMFGVGSDSQISIDAAEELRLLDYGQRLIHRRRAVLGAPGQSIGRRLYDGACRGGARAAGRALGSLAHGSRADLVVLDEDHPSLAGKDGDAILDSHIFANHGRAVRDVMVGGQWVVKDGRHIREEEIAARFATVMKNFQDDL